MENKDIILFDGVCNLCNGAVLFIIKRDYKKQFKFASLQSDIGVTLLNKHKIDPITTDSIILIKDGVAYAKAAAILHIAKHLSGGWPLLYPFIIIPSCISNTVYDFIARRRYKWFGKKDSCMIPTPDLNERFLDT